MPSLQPLDNSPHKLRVLVADAAPMNSRLLAEAIQREGNFVAATAADAREVVEAAASGLFQVALLSAEFQESAIQALRLLRKVRRIDAKLAVVALVNFPDRDLVVRLFQ